ncbi:MAG: glycosyltransferase [Muribaculaceae bacterium]|nr:glycosyltransferase [Muribaculaceae bacterium]
MTLDVVIATYGPEGIERVSKMFLPKTENVKYIVSWQNHQDGPIPENLQRDDISIYRLNNKGVSNNRNNAIAQSKADLIYLSDDDIILMPEALQKIMQRFDEYPDTDMATFMMYERNRKKYPEGITDLGFYLPKGYNVGTYQMAFKRNLFPAIQFNTAFGPNSGKFETSEDELFHLTFRKKGYKCRFFPDVIASHPHEATGRRAITDPRAIYGMGAIITLSFPKTFWLRIPIKAYRMYKNGQYKLLSGIRDLAIGSIKSFKVKI